MVDDKDDYEYVEEVIESDDDDEYEEHVIKDFEEAELVAAVEAAGGGAPMSDQSKRAVVDATMAAQDRLEAYRKKRTDRLDQKARARAARLRALDVKLANTPAVQIGRDLFATNQILTAEFRKRNKALLEQEVVEKVWFEEQKKRNTVLEKELMTKFDKNNKIVEEEEEARLAKIAAWEEKKDKEKADKAAKKADAKRKKEEQEKRKADREAAKQQAGVCCGG